MKKATKKPAAKKTAPKRPRKAKKSAVVWIKRRLPADPPRKGPEPAPKGKPAQSRLIASEPAPPVPALPRPKKTDPKVRRLWYAVAVRFGWKDEKVRKALAGLKKDIQRNGGWIGRVISPKHVVEELKLVGKCTCPKEEPPKEEDLPPPETPRGLKVRKAPSPYPRRIGECHCPKIPTKVKRKKFPGYLILQADLTPLVHGYIQGTGGVECVLMGKENVVAVDTEEAAELLLERKEQNVPKPKPDNPSPSFAVGANVEVIGDKYAPWFGQRGKVVETSVPPNMTTKVEFILLGRPVYATFDSRTLKEVQS